MRTWAIAGVAAVLIATMSPAAAGTISGSTGGDKGKGEQGGGDSGHGVADCDPGAVTVRTLVASVTITGFSVATTKNMALQGGCGKGYLWVKVTYKNAPSSTSRYAYGVLNAQRNYTGANARSLFFTAKDWYPTVATAAAHLANSATITSALNGPWDISAVDIVSASILVTTQAQPASV